MNPIITRRTFLKVSSLTAAMAALSACNPAPAVASAKTGAAINDPAAPTSLPPLPLTAISNNTLNALLLRRISFGATLSDFQHVQQNGLTAYLEEQLNPDLPDNPQIDSLLQPLTTLNMSFAERAALANRNQPAIELMQATLIHQYFSTRQLYEMMVDFWSNHFNIYIFKSLDIFLKTDDDSNVIRKYALDTFPNLLMASAHSPAMLIFLDNASSTKDVPNENYARELMELHTISVNGGYSQQDIENMARALTGWSIASQKDPNPGQFMFRPFIHDTGDKQVMSLHIPEGGGIQDGEQVLQFLAAQPMTAQFLATKLVRHFVSDSPPTSLVNKAAAAFSQSSGDIRRVLRAILLSDEFKSSAGQKIKRPLEFFHSALRGLNAQVDFTRPVLLQIIRQFGQLPFNWETPDGYPDVSSAWINTSGMLNRWNFGLALANGQIPGVTVDIADLVKDGQSVADQIDLLSLNLIGEKIPSDARDILISYATGNNSSNLLQNLAGLMIGSPHFQYR
ncbi:MAG: DUF1800 family protein [Anaerolineaceae bacterium]|nr:DUF1800 family protein [Anaerolineaceae bacterium]